MSKSMGPEALRILVVDDSEISRRITSTILRSHHWTVCGEAEDGKDGVEKFQELKPDVSFVGFVYAGHDRHRSRTTNVCGGPYNSVNPVHSAGSWRDWRCSPPSRDSGTGGRRRLSHSGARPEKGVALWVLNFVFRLLSRGPLFNVTVRHWPRLSLRCC